MDQKELLGFHKGSLNTLVKEYNELSKMIGIVHNLINYHQNELKKMGVSVGVNEKKEQQETTDDSFSKLDRI